MKKAVHFIKKETVFCISAFLALISLFFVPVSEKYISYIDIRVLSVLLGLMLIMSALKNIEIFDIVCTLFLQKTKNMRQLASVLVMLCFFSSMFITNDVALVAFVPFSIFSLKKVGREDKAISIIVLQTIAANLGSMILPSGNPQNLYLYNLSGISMQNFIKLLLPYTITALLMLTALIMFHKNEPICYSSKIETSPFTQKNKLYAAIYAVLFVLGILTVCRVIPYYIFLGLTLIGVFLCDKKSFIGVDYFLLLTFICFFIFIGNVQNIEIVKNTLQSVVKGKEVLIGILSSQVISNVPAALMLSGFTEDYNSLVIGVDIGGLGTLIASMASLISYKIYAENFKETKGKYILYFTLYNLLFLGVLFGLWLVIH